MWPPDFISTRACTTVRWNPTSSFAERSPRSFFAPLGLQQAARSYEALGRNKDAIAVYQRLEKDYADSAVADQVLYDAGRLYQMEGDLFKSRESFNRLMALFPKSPFARKARERLMLLGLVEAKRADSVVSRPPWRH